MSLNGKWPGIIRSFDTTARMYRVEIPGVTDGAEVLPLAEMEYPIGDKSKHEKFATEIEILEGDKVWLEFERGDARYPIITGYRNDRSGNSTGWRRFHHANIELNAGDEEVGVIYLKAGAQVHVVAKQIFTESDELIAHCKTATVNAEETISMEAGNTVTIKAGARIKLDAPDVDVTHKATIAGLLTYLAGMAGSGTAPGGGAASIQGNVNITSGDLTVEGIGFTPHRHQEHDGPMTGGAQA